MIDVIRAWKDPSYRSSLGTEDRALLPLNPAGQVELTDLEVREASGLGRLEVTTGRTCTMSTFHRFQCCP